MTSETAQLRSGSAALAVSLAVGLLFGCTAIAASSASTMPPGRFFFRTIGSEQGLGNLAIQDVVQDEAGFLWVATQDGLYRYDGQRFERFGVEAGIPSSSITSLLAGPGDALWIGTREGLSRREGNRFVVTPLPAKLLRPVINDLARDGQDGIWVATTDGLYRSHRDGSFGKVPAWPRGGANAVFADPVRRGSAYAAQGQRVGRIDADGSGTFWNTGLGASDSIEALAVDGEGTLWASTPLLLLRKKMAEQTFHDETVTLGSRLSMASRTVLALDSDRTLWLPTVSGLLKRSRGGWRHLGLRAGLPGRSADGVFFDREGSLWAWQIGVGLHRQLGRGVWESWTKAEGLPADIVWSVVRDRSQRLWVGTDAGLVEATLAGWRTVAGTEGLAIRRIAEAADGSLWLAAKPSQVLRFRPGSGAPTSFAAAEGVTGRILDLLVDRHGGVWIGTLDDGLRHLPPGASRFERVESPFDAEEVTSVQEDAAGRLWIAGPSSLAVREGSVWRTLSPPGRGGPIYFLLTGSDEVWVTRGPQFGVQRLQFQRGSLRLLEQRAAIPGRLSRPYFLGLDRAGRNWVGTGRGVDVLTAEGSDHFDTRSGLVGDDCDHLAFWNDANGDVFIGTSQGLSRLRGDRYAGRAAAPPTKIISATVGGQLLASSEATLAAYPRRQNTFEVGFATLSFADEAALERQVRLVGLEDNWRGSPGREARYPLLPAGRYRFEARARYGDGPWGSPATVEFQIEPAWWETWPARGLLALLVGALIWTIAWLHERKLRRRQVHLEGLVEARTREVSTANRRLELANADLGRLVATDGLTGIANRRAFDQEFERELRRAERAKEPITVLLVDVDHFKAYNDTYGHPAGDDCLRRVAQALAAAATRAGDLVARFGGEEFAFLLPNTDRLGAAALAERARVDVLALGIRHSTSNSSAHVTVSVGAVSCLPAEVSGAAELIRYADGELYRAKAAGRNRSMVRHLTAPLTPLRLVV
jgi:diguanylate cyclase (GGDEF)-like protein